MTLVLLLISASFLLSYAIIIFTINTEYPGSDQVAQVRERLTLANDQMNEAFSKAEDITRALIDATEAREIELATLRERYATLEALVEGQEGIAKAHREILRSRTLTERIVEVGLGLFIGVISTLLGALLLGLWRIRRRQQRGNGGSNSGGNGDDGSGQPPTDTPIRVQKSSVTVTKARG